ncbi:hypothetical protein M911_07565 [Ectothiorhodospira haloalkaliphila]|uniref:Response regulatory domain-containing protein n=1 Tax=Ectothiorhodospira haloalkaliphila TaxID=421628 RepID=W8KLM2_9GAMM|nr:response regulator [Ectothiorhodospira haloalkaliphila]AHK80664.1 hypothetical protein M911_07565 [Ectothiorhodospira haloalkaliphila]
MTSPADTSGPQDDAPLILVVDDSRVMRQALNKILRRRYQVVDAPDGMEAWTLLEQNPGIACVFTDLSMPQLDGYGLLQRIRESDDARLKTLPVVIVTGNEDDQGTRRKAAERGANDVVMKPFRADHVLNTTEQLLAGGETPPAATAPTPMAEATPRPAAEPHPDTAALAAAQTEIKTLRDQLQHAQSQARAAVKERERLQSDMRQLRTELMLRQQTSDERDAKDRIAALEADLAKEREALEEAQRANGQLRTRLHEQQEQAERSQERLEGLQGELQEASAQLLQRDAQIQEASAARDQAQGELHALRQELEQLRREPAEGDADEVRRLKAELESARERTGAAERALASSNGRASGESQGNLQARAEAAELARLQVEDELVQAISRVERMEQEREASRGGVAHPARRTESHGEKATATGAPGSGKAQTPGGPARRGPGCPGKLRFPRRREGHAPAACPARCRPRACAHTDTVLHPKRPRHLRAPLGGKPATPPVPAQSGPGWRGCRRPDAAGLFPGRGAAVVLPVGCPGAIG